LKKLSKKTKNILETLLYIFLGYLIAIGANKGLAYALETDYPVVAVVSRSMEHHAEKSYYTWFMDRSYDESEMERWSFKNGIKKGDIVFVKGMPHGSIMTGDVIVYKIGNTEPIIHRVIDKNDNGFYTKGDNNMELDQEDTIPPIKEENLQGRAVFRVPLLGYVKIIFMTITGGG